MTFSRIRESLKGRVQKFCSLKISLAIASSLLWLSILYTLRLEATINKESYTHFRYKFSNLAHVPFNSGINLTQQGQKISS